MKNLLFCIIILTAAVGFAQEIEETEFSFPVLGWLISWLEETDSELRGYAETGKRSSLEDWEDESTDSDYSYSKLNIAFSQDPFDRFSYKVSGLVQDKDYDTANNLDNVSKTFKTGIDYDLWKDGDRSLKLDADILYGDKEYENTPADDYIRLKAASAISYRVKDICTSKLTLGIDTYDYSNASAKNRFKPFARAQVWRYLLDRKFRFTGSYTFKSIRQDLPGIEQIQRDIRVGADYRFDLPAIKKGLVRAGLGNRDTLEDPDIDGTFDYEYVYTYVKTYHTITEKVGMNLKYQVFSKDYTTANSDHTGFFFQNGWNVEILKRKEFKAKLDIDAEYKKADYDLAPADSYTKVLVQSGFTLQKTKDWKISAGLQANFYDYEDPAKDKTRSYIGLSGEKILKKGDLRLNLDLKYRYTDYDNQNDDSKSSIRAGARMAFYSYKH